MEDTEQQICRQIAARIWCDPEMSHVEMDTVYAEELARIIRRVREAQE